MSTESCNEEDLSTTSSYTSAYSIYSNTNDDEIQQQQSKANISNEITNLKRHINSLVREHQELTSNRAHHTVQQEHNNEQSCGMKNSIQDEILHTIYNIENQLNILYNTQQYIQQRSSQITNIVKDRIHTELLIREEMESEMKELYSQKIIYEKELHDLKVRLKDCTCSTTTSCSDAEKKKSDNDEAMVILKQEIQTLRGENASLKNDLEELNDEIRSLSQCQPTTVVAADDTLTIQQQSLKSISQQEEEAAASQQRIRALAQSQETGAMVVPRERFGSSVSGSTLEMIDGTSVSIAGGGRERLDTAGSAEDMNHISLFDENTIDKDTNDNKDTPATAEGIRMHAEKLLFWANKATERSNTPQMAAASQTRMDGSTPFNTPQKVQPQQQQHQQELAAIPMSIGLPPRSQSRVVRNSSQLPPRCPSPNIATQVQVTISASSSVSQDDVAVSSINDMDTHSEELSDKENGGLISFNQKQEEGAIPGAFPKLKKNVSLSQHDIIINDYDNEYNNNDEDMGYEECSTSPFTDHQSEFYLPQLGLASIEDRLSFSNNPTALSNILRPWQYHFLASLDVHTADELLKAHKNDANDLSRKMKKWRKKQGNLVLYKTKECYAALKIWARTCKVVLRSIQKQREEAKTRSTSSGMEEEGGVDEEQQDNGADNNEENVIIEKPQFLDISFSADTHTITSVSTLGQLSSVGGGGRPFEMMEI